MARSCCSPVRTCKVASTSSACRWCGASGSPSRSPFIGVTFFGVCKSCGSPSASCPWDGCQQSASCSASIGAWGAAFFQGQPPSRKPWSSGATSSSLCVCARRLAGG
eukprot:4503576-Heterocapsa_arctica.AAC.1